MENNDVEKLNISQENLEVLEEFDWDIRRMASEICNLRMMLEHTSETHDGEQ